MALRSTDHVPAHLVASIFAKMPAKSVLRLGGITEEVQSEVETEHFADDFLVNSANRPCLFLAVYRPNHPVQWQFFTTPEESPDRESSRLTYLTSFSGDDGPFLFSYSLGICYFSDVQFPEEVKTSPLILNPCSGYSTKLPQMQKNIQSRGFLGFDPIDGQFKVLSEAYPDEILGRDQHRILRLGTEELNWQNDNTTVYAQSLSESICIEGFVYFLARKSNELYPVIVSFDVRHEELQFIRPEFFIGQDDPAAMTLVNYKGNLAGIYKKINQAGSVELDIWVFERHLEWVNRVYILPENPLLHCCSIAGLTAKTGDIVLVMDTISKPFLVFYFSPRRNTLRSVEIEGFEEATVGCRVYTFVNHLDQILLPGEKKLNHV